MSSVVAFPESLGPPSVLLVDDTPANLLALSAVLKELGARIVQARSGEEAVALVARETFAVVLLDVQMPGMDGFETATRIRTLENGRELPIIFLTAIHRDERYIREGYAAGAADYITKPFDADIVRARVKAFVDLFGQREQLRVAQVGLRTRERDEAVRRLVALERIATAALETSDLAVFLKELLEILVSASAVAESAAVFLRDGEMLRLQSSVGLDLDANEPTAIAMGEGFVGAIAASRQGAEIEHDPDSFRQAKLAWPRAAGTRALYGLPLMHEGEVLGVAHIGSQRAAMFPEVEKRIFSAMVQRASLAVSSHLKRSRLHDVLMAAPAMISIVRAPSMVIEFANPGFRALFEGRDLVGQHIRETKLGETALAVLVEAHRTEKIIAFEELSVTGSFGPGGETAQRYFRFTAQPLRNASGTVDSVLTFAFDVTLQVEARRAIEAHEAERSELLRRETAARAAAEVASQAKDAFLATVSHELRTPLNAMLGWTVIAREKAPPELDHALGIVERNARSQARIIEDVLDISRIASGKLRLDVAPVDIRELALAALETVRPAADAKAIVVDIEDDGADAIAPADGERIQQIVWNLLSNAIKFTPKEGRVTLALRASRSDVTVCVSDTGQGIATAFLPHVFEAFRQGDASTTRRHSGLGLGLAIVSQLVQAHGGTIAAKSDGPGTGSTFEFSIPIKASAPLEPRPRRAPSGPASRPTLATVRLDGLKVLVVDDDEDSRLLLREQLADHGALVVEAASASSGLEQVESFRPDVMVSDIAMPGGDGYSLIRAVRKLTRDCGGRTPAIALTAHARGEDGDQAFAAGFQRYAAKPVDLAELMLMVANLGGITFAETDSG